MIKKVIYRTVLILLISLLLILPKTSYFNNYDPNLIVPIIVYHHIDNVITDEITTVTPQKFSEDMNYLKYLGYETISFKELYKYKNGQGTMPKKPIIITFDDGYESNYTIAYPILKKLNLKATISIIGWSVGLNTNPQTGKKIFPHFTWAQAKEMYESGLVDIQYHTYNLHNTGDGVAIRKGVLMNKGENVNQYKQILIEDYTKLKDLIKFNTGNDIFVYTYPYGLFNYTSENLLSQLGVKVSLTTQDGVNKISDGLFKMKRINVSNGISSSELFNGIQKLIDQKKVTHLQVNR